MILFCFRSEENGNCLFSAFSIVMSGDNRYVDDLRILASIELYLNSEFYAKCPSFVKVMNSHSGVFNNVDTLLALGGHLKKFWFASPDRLFFWTKKTLIFWAGESENFKKSSNK